MARDIVRYLSDNHGIAPEELRPGRFEVERRLIDWSYEPDEDVEDTCSQCHSMGRVITQRRTREEWDLLMATHRGYYPLSDGQGFMRFGGSSRHPKDAAVAHLSDEFPLVTPEWSAWSATKRSPRIAGTWALSGHDPGFGPIYGTAEISEGADPSSFITRLRYEYARTGEQVERDGRSIVLHRLPVARPLLRRRERGDCAARGDDGRARLERDQRALVHGRLRRVRAGCEAGARERPGAAGAASGGDAFRDHGDGNGARGEPGHRVGTRGCRSGTRSGAGSRRCERVGQVHGRGGGRRGRRSGRPGCLSGRQPVPGSLTVYETIDRIAVAPQAGMARVGGGNFPKGICPVRGDRLQQRPRR